MFHKKSDLTISFILQCDVGFFYDEPCKITKIYLIMKIVLSLSCVQHFLNFRYM